MCKKEENVQTEQKLKGSNIPYIPISKEVIFLMCSNLEDNEFAEFLNALKNYLYYGVEPQFTKKSLNSTWEQLTMSSERLAQKYFASVENGKKGGRPKKEKPIDTKVEEVDNGIPMDENVNMDVITKSMEYKTYNDYYTYFMLGKNGITQSEVDDKLMLLFNRFGVFNQKDRDKITNNAVREYEYKYCRN